MFFDEINKTKIFWQMFRNKKVGIILFLILGASSLAFCHQLTSDLHYSLDALQTSHTFPKMKSIPLSKSQQDSSDMTNTQALSTQIENSSSDIREAIEKEAQDIRNKLENQTEILEMKLREETENLEESIYSRINESQEELTESLEEINHRLDEIEERTKNAEAISIESARMVLQSQIDTYVQELESIEDEINALAVELPTDDNQCKAIQDCNACVANDACGWCLSSGTCVQGNMNGPLFEECPFYDYQICTGGKDCNRLKDCFVNLRPILIN